MDFFVPDNNVVSGIHADILTENREYFIRDNHSTNGTYVNGSRLEGDQRVRLNDGDRFTLANEEFEFHME
ncbi:MAG: FHA domain-containing protein [Clostridiales bacterium]|nr:FHA domain-containing protein [Clostridiales bacterium]